MPDNASRFIGAFTGFAVGDAYGLPSRRMTFEEICRRFEPNGCLRLPLEEKTKTALFSDATQLMLFTVDGLLWAVLSEQENASEQGIDYAEYVFYALQMWLHTQRNEVAGEYAWLLDKNRCKYRSKLIRTKGMRQVRSADTVTADALAAMRNGMFGSISRPCNELCDSGGMKRVLPVGLFFSFNSEYAFRAGADFAAITHGHPLSYLSAGVYAAVIAEVTRGESMDDALANALALLRTYRKHVDVAEMLELVIACLADEKLSPVDALSQIVETGKYLAPVGAYGDWSAVTVLGTVLYCAALHEDSYTDAIALAVNTDGPGDTCGAMVGGLLGAYHGADFIPKKWVTKLSLLRLVEDMAISLVENSYFAEEEESGVETSEEEDALDNPEEEIEI